MRRSKILISPLNNHQPPVKAVENNVTDMELKITLAIEFEGVKTFDLSNIVKELNREQSLMRTKEIIKFKEYVLKFKSSSLTQKSMIEAYKKFIKDLNAINPSYTFSSPEGMESLYKFYLAREKSGEINSNTLNNKRKILIALWRDCYGQETDTIVKYFPVPAKRQGKLHGATIVKDLKKDGVVAKCYSKNDFKLLKSMLLFYGRKLSKLYKNQATPEKIKLAPIVFTYDVGVHYLDFTNTSNVKTAGGLCNVVGNKATVFYMMLFISITAANLSPAMRLKRKDLVIRPGERDLYTIELNDRRKSKIMTQPHLVKKYHLKLINEIVDYSVQIDDSEDAFLFPLIQAGGVITSFSSKAVNSQINVFTNRCIEGELGEKLSVSPKKLRDSHGQQFDDIGEKREILGNSIGVAERYYTDGNPLENTDKLQQGMNAYTLSLLSGEPISNVNKRFNSDIDIKLIESEEGSAILREIYASRTMAGGICKNSVTSPEAIRFNRLLKKLDLIDEEELRCNNILACFTCVNHVFVNEEDDLYLLISLKIYLQDSLYNNEAGGLFGSRDLVDRAINEIEWMLDNKYSKSMVKGVKRRISLSGVHPLWRFD